MKTLCEKMNIKFGEVENAHILKRVNMGFASYDTLCLICAELNINLDDVSDNDFDSAANILKDFVSSANKATGYTVSVWFDK